MKLLFINVSLRPDSKRKLLPIGLGYILTAVKNRGIDFDLFDMDIQSLPPEAITAFIKGKDYDVVAMGTIISGYGKVKTLARLIRKELPGAKIIAGNTVATARPELLLSKTEIDIAVLGEGDITIIDLLKAIKSKSGLDTVNGIAFEGLDGKITFTKPRSVIEDVDSLPFIDWDIFDFDAYFEYRENVANASLFAKSGDIRPMILNTARGCIYKCTFCYHAFQNEKYRWRSAKNIVAEIKQFKDKYDVNHVSFFDELSFFNKKQVVEFVDEFEKAGLDIWWYAVVRGDMFTEDDHELLVRMKNIKCESLAYSIESASDKILKLMDKRMDMNQFAAQKRALDKAGINSACSAVFGMPLETKETIWETINFCLDLGIYPSSGFLLPLPGTPMYDHALEHRYITDEDDYLTQIGDRQDLHLNMTKLSSEELVGEVEKGLRMIADRYNLNVPDASLFKTTTYKVVKK